MIKLLIPMLHFRITTSEGQLQEFPGFAKDLDSPKILFQELRKGETNVEGVLAMMQYKLYCKESKYKTPIEFLDSEDSYLIDNTWDALMSKGWKLEILP